MRRVKAWRQPSSDVLPRKDSQRPEMAGAQMARLLRPGRWLWRMGLGLPILLGLVLALGILVSRFTGSGYEPPEQLKAGRVDEFAVAAPKYFEQERFWLGKLGAGGILALYDRDTESQC